MLIVDIANKLPAWMAQTARKQWTGLMSGPAAVIDVLGELIFEGRLAALPGQLDIAGGNGFDNFDALPLIGRDRSIRPGLAESPFEYAARLRAWLEEWARAATPLELLLQLQGILSPNPPILRIVNGAGVWWQLDPDGTIHQFTHTGAGFFYSPTNGVAGNDSTVAHAWDWDSLADPHPFGWGDASRFWVIIYAPCNLPYLAAISGTVGDGRFVGAGSPGPEATTVGTVAPSKEVSLIRVTIEEWRAAGAACSHVIIAFDPSSFAPDGSSAVYPAGDFGWPCHLVGGVMASARLDSARYWVGPSNSFNGFVP